MESNQEENDTENVSKSFFSNLSLRGQPKFKPKKLKDLNTEVLNKQVSELVEASEGWDSWNWEFVQEEKGVTITRTAIPNSPLKCTKGVTIFKGNLRSTPLLRSEAAPRDVLDIVTNINSYKRWDDKILDSRLVTAINSHTSTNYIEFAPSFPVTGRDFSFLQHIQRQDDGTYVVSWHSIKDDSIPKKKGVVRASMGNSGFIITPIKPYEPSQPMRSLVTFVVQFDYKGWIPHNVMNQITASQPMILYFVGEELERLKEMNMTRKFSIYASKPPSFDNINVSSTPNYDEMIPTNPPPEPPAKTKEEANKENKEN